MSQNSSVSDEKHSFSDREIPVIEERRMARTGSLNIKRSKFNLKIDTNPSVFR